MDETIPTGERSQSIPDNAPFRLAGPSPEKSAVNSPGSEIARSSGVKSKISQEEAEAIRAKALEILRSEVPPAPHGVASQSASILDQPPPGAENVETIPARMLNEFVYCKRLFYYEFVEGVFVENADTLRGAAIHRRVDSGTGSMPAAGGKSRTNKKSADAKASEQDGEGDENNGTEGAEQETIHSRSVQMGSERLGVIAKMDLIEIRPVKAATTDAETPEPHQESAGETQADFTEELFRYWEVCPVDYKAGSPKEGEETNELWDTDKMQLGLQALILRDNGYVCDEGIIYYRSTKQRVRLPIKPELEEWILQNLAEARTVAKGPIPPPLVNSPKCVRCSLAPICLPDETRMLAQPSLLLATPRQEPEQGRPRKLIAARDDTRPLYLSTQGIRVGCKEEVLQIKDKDRVVEEVRIRDLSHVALFGNVQISTQAVQALCDLEVPLTYFSMGGWFYGITHGHVLKNVFLRIEQFRLAQDAPTCLSLARQIVHGKIRNHRTMLMRNHVEPPAPTIAKLKRASEDALEATSIEQLLGIEGAAANFYFQEFGGMIKIEDDLAETNGEEKEKAKRMLTFNFATRNRRPPTNPVNAMLSLAYSLLGKDCTLACLAVGFDPYVGFYHQPRFGRPALGLDLVEEFRPLIAESTVLSCINNRVVTERDFVRAGQAVNLTAAGRKRFFQMYEQRMSSLITHPLFDYKVSYRRALELQARLLAKALTGEISEYMPLLTR